MIRALLAIISGMFYLIPSAIDGDIVVEEFYFPQYDENGKLEYVLKGDEAIVSKQDVIQIKTFELSYETPEGPLLVSTPFCIYDRANERAFSTSVVHVTHGEMTLTGRGFEWTGKAGMVKIHENVRLVLARDRLDETKGDADN